MLCYCVDIKLIQANIEIYIYSNLIYYEYYLNSIPLIHNSLGKYSRTVPNILFSHIFQESGSKPCKGMF